jgi:hypothetical protein
MMRFSYLVVALLLSITCQAQDADSVGSKPWSFNPDLNFYFIPDDFFVLPVMRADWKWLHLEARYNYEDRETFSAWVGYNFSGGKKLQFTITPMVGAAFGLTQGITTGIESTFSIGRFELYSESEYLIDPNNSENNFYYNWSDLTYSPTDWLWVGISGQRTKVYETDLDFQRGILVGGGLKWWEVTTYLFNIGYDDTFVILTFSVYF